MICCELTSGDLDIVYFFCSGNVSWLSAVCTATILILEVLCLVRVHLHMCYIYQTCLLHVHGLPGCNWLSLLFYIKLSVIFVNWNESVLDSSLLMLERNCTRRYSIDLCSYYLNQRLQQVYSVQYLSKTRNSTLTMHCFNVYPLLRPIWSTKVWVFFNQLWSSLLRTYGNSDVHWMHTS